MCLSLHRVEQFCSEVRFQRSKKANWGRGISGSRANRWRSAPGPDVTVNMVLHLLSALLEKLRCFVSARWSVHFRKYSACTSDLLHRRPDPLLVDRHALTRLVAQHFFFSASIARCGL